MSVYSVLELMLNDILNVIKPLREDWEIRFQVINQLQEVVGSVDSLRGDFLCQNLSSTVVLTYVANKIFILPKKSMYFR